MKRTWEVFLEFKCLENPYRSGRWRRHLLISERKPVIQRTDRKRAGWKELWQSLTLKKVRVFWDRTRYRVACTNVWAVTSSCDCMASLCRRVWAVAHPGEIHRCCPVCATVDSQTQFTWLLNSESKRRPKSYAVPSQHFWPMIDITPLDSIPSVWCLRPPKLCHCLPAYLNLSQFTRPFSVDKYVYLKARRITMWHPYDKLNKERSVLPAASLYSWKYVIISLYSHLFKDHLSVNPLTPKLPQNSTFVAHFFTCTYW